MLNHNYKNYRKKSGYITLLSVLVVGAVGVAATLSIILSGLGSSRTSFTYEQMNQAKALANTCAENALEQIRISTPFTGNGALSLGQGSCTFSVSSQGGQARAIDATGTVGTVVRRVRIVITAIHPLINISTWQEVP